MKLYTKTWLCMLALGSLFACSDSGSSPSETVKLVDPTPTLVETASGVTVQEGFVVEHLYSPSDHEQGSWVAIANDGKGGFYVSDQFGFLYHISVPAIGEAGEPVVKKLDLELGWSNGLLWAHNSLYVMVNAREGRGIGDNYMGLYRVTDSNADGELDDIKLLRRFTGGSGEHGPHAIIEAPDGENLYILCGNHIDVTQYNTLTRPETWQEDGLFPAYKDARGHAADRMAPGGWIAKIDPNGQNWELISTGYRNAYDMAFNADGELFAFDADMEWDMGMPWYRPIRLCHATSGSEFGWRTGSGKWPVYYPDALPPVVDIGQGSPTGVIAGMDAKFPARYQHGMFIFDWSFGTMYFIDLIQHGSSYVGTKEEFLSGVPLPLTDGVIGEDGAMYFATGGRRLDSDFYRVYYTGEASTEKADPPKDTGAEKLRKIRRKLESYHKKHHEAVAFAQNYLDHEDRFIRYAARMAIEHQPVSEWQNYITSESNDLRRVQWIIAAAHSGDPTVKEDVYEALEKFNMRTRDEDMLLRILRAQSLAMIRFGTPERKKDLKNFRESLAGIYPTSSPRVNLELCRMLVLLEDEDVVRKTIALLDKKENSIIQTTYISSEIVKRSEQYGPTIEAMLEKLPPSQEISYVESLSHAKTGWTPELRERYFQWFYDAMSMKGGESYKGFLDRMRENALGYVSEKEKAALADISGALHFNAGSTLEGLPQPTGPGKVREPGDFWDLFENNKNTPRSFENGKKMYAAAFCQSCHTMRGEGGNIGPDLTQISTRFSTRDMIYALLLPSQTISDQYGSHVITRKDGTKVAGRILDEEGDVVKINPNPYLPNQVIEIAKTDIDKQEVNSVSLMPPGLINALNDKELLDLMAYLEAGGDAGNEVYR